MGCKNARSAPSWALLIVFLSQLSCSAALADTFLSRVPMALASGCQYRAETSRIAEVPKAERYSLTEIAQQIRRNPQLLNDLLARMPGRFVRLSKSLPGVPIHYDFYPAQNGSSAVEFKLGGIGDGVDKMRENAAYIAAHTQFKNIIYLSLSGQDLTLLLHHLEGSDHSANYYAETLKAVLYEATEIVPQDIEAGGLAPTPLDRNFVLNTLSWSGQLTMDFIADPRYNRSIEGVIFEDPGAQSLDRYFAPFSIDSAHTALEAQDRMLEDLGVPAFFNVPRLFADLYRFMYRFSLNAALYHSFPRFRNDPLLRRGTVDMVSGLYGVDGPRRLSQAPARIWIKILIAGKGDVVPHALLERVAVAAMSREGGLGKQNTSVELLEGARHELPRITDPEFHRGIADRTYRDFSPGWAIVSGNQVITRDEREVRHRLGELNWEWGRQNAWRNGRGP